MIKSIILVSGGLDSAVAAAIATKEASGSPGSPGSKDEYAFLHVNYGQRTEARELKAFNAIAEWFKIKERLVADIGYLKDIGGSALTDTGIAVPTAEPQGGSIPVTYVPFRNAHLLSIAVSWAEVTGASNIYIGAVEEDGPGYPDCRRAFFDSFERTVAAGTRAGTEEGRPIKVITPLINMRKGDIVKLGKEINAPMHLSWSCYSESEVACGVCDSCALRLGGFKEAGIEDPIGYR